MSGRMWVLAVTGWVGVVIAGSVLTWIAISRAGDQVTDNPQRSTTLPAVVSTLGAAPSATPTGATRPSRTPSAAPPATAGPTQVAPTSAGTPTVRSGTPTPRASAPTVTTETRTWSGAAGFVTVACTDRQARLTGASPGNGWSYEVGDRAGDSVEVKFSSGQDQVEVHATCVGGTPHFEVDSSTD